MNVVVPRYRPSVFSYLGLRGDGWLDFTSCGSCYSRLLFPTSLSSQVLFSFVLAPFKSITWVCVFKLEGLLHHDPVLDRHSWSLFYSLGPFLLTIEFFKSNESSGLLTDWNRSADFQPELIFFYCVPSVGLENWSREKFPSVRDIVIHSPFF
jgi:hypothetical protein